MHTHTHREGEREAGQEKEKEEAQESSYPPVHCLDVYSDCDWVRSKSGVEHSVLVSHINAGN